jgi:hypothetical protein
MNDSDEYKGYEPDPLIYMKEKEMQDKIIKDALKRELELKDYYGEIELLMKQMEKEVRGIEEEANELLKQEYTGYLKEKYNDFTKYYDIYREKSVDNPDQIKQLNNEVINSALLEKVKNIINQTPSVKPPSVKPPSVRPPSRPSPIRRQTSPKRQSLIRRSPSPSCLLRRLNRNKKCQNKTLLNDNGKQYCMINNRRNYIYSMDKPCPLRVNKYVKSKSKSLKRRKSKSKSKSCKGRKMHTGKSGGRYCLRRSKRGKVRKQYIKSKSRRRRS